MSADDMKAARDGAEQRMSREDKEEWWEGDPRSEFEHDRDRILYSSAFRRLAGVAQVAAVREKHLLHNRLTHSLKVAQLGRRMAERLLKIDEDRGRAGEERKFENEEWLPEVTEAAGLAHDLGHPPFGHIAEEVLHRHMQNFGSGFEGNAQSFRIVVNLASRKEGVPGLNLTRATRNAILKYPRFMTDPPESGKIRVWHNRKYGEKWGAYDTEYDAFSDARLGFHDEKTRMRCAAAILMDWADDVSYATHDLADYFRAGLIPLDAIRDEFRIKDDSGTKKWRRKAFMDFSFERLGRNPGFSKDAYETNYNALGGERGELGVVEHEWMDRRQDRLDLVHLINALIRKFASAAELASDPPYVQIAPSAQYQVEILKQFAWFYVIKHPALSLTQEGQKRIIDALFSKLVTLLGDARNQVPAHLSDIYEQSGEVRDDLRRARAVCDYICFLTEDQALDLYEKVTGLSVSRGSIFGAWFGK
ncbi:dNTP triphosphohydrolase [Streptomyces sp. PSKA54]|uniref:DNTP triphosphohydrolase n=1 Tax=Streptomyces himalayensis subsp. aureolus TaxID=2758039 RepID=A0A7W2D7X3_9ACTN|nr:dNTP triphosphohydrolase [Streptomyces himalayensis]MBA4866273.1 dNTP triphosphohydrolase [Streptomyces himalayensis subsp. aureolus]